MIHFDKKTISNWQEKNINTISVFFYESGCAGTKIRVEESIIDGTQLFGTQDEISIYAKADEIDFIDGGKITFAGGKWIFTNETVNTRCGCGSSFSLKSNSPLQDKIARMKLTIKQKKEGVHI